MKEITSAYDDIEKRMAIFLGLGAMIFSSLYLFTQGADIYTYLVRGVLALILFSVVGWAYGHWLKNVIRKQLDEEQRPPFTQAEMTSNSEMSQGKVTIQANDGADAVIPAEHSSGRAVDFTLPELEPFNDSAPPSTGI